MRPDTSDDAITRLYFQGIFMDLEYLFTLDNLNQAFYETAKASRWKAATQRYRMNLLQNNLQLQQDILDNSYRVSPTVNFHIRERGKERYIESPAIRDRIVQKIITQKVLSPALEPLLIYDNYASLKHRGTSLARKRIEIMLREHIKEYGTDGYILQIDVKRYFDNVNHEILKNMIHAKVHAPQRVMDLIDYGIDTSSKTEIGINLGSEEPQIFAIYYLSPIDNYCKIVKGIKHYGRYMDDIFIIHRDKAYLKSLLTEIEQQLARLKLGINEKKTHIIKLTHGFTYLQICYSIDGNRIIKRPTHAKVARERRRLRRFAQNGDLTPKEAENCYKSWRNTILKDCNACAKTIYSTDKLFQSLFTVTDESKDKRANLINKTFKEATHEDLQYIW